MSGNDDLRSFIESVRQQCPREYTRIDQMLSTDWEMAAVVAKLEAKMRCPLLEFAALKNTQFPVITNVCGSLSRVARSLGLSAHELEARMLQAYANPIAPNPWSHSATPPVRELVYRNNEVNLLLLPQIRYTEKEEAPYLSAACVSAYDPITGIHNISFHRLMILGRNRTAIFMTPEGHLDQIYRANAAQNKPTPIAIFIGSHPLWSIGALAAGRFDMDEFGIIGALLEYPLEITNGLIDDRLRLPARAEIALEGYIRHDRHAMEGPYGEALGYVSEKQSQPVVEIEFMTTRSKPIFQDIVPGRMEHMSMTGIAVRAHLEKSLVQKFKYISEVHIPIAMTLLIKLNESIPGQEIKNLLREILQEQRYVKQAIVLDADIEIKNVQQVQWAVATRVQADRDILLLDAQPGCGIDPSERNGKTSKWGIDATLNSDTSHQGILNKVPQDVMDRIDLKDLIK